MGVLGLLRRILCRVSWRIDRRIGYPQLGHPEWTMKGCVRRPQAWPLSYHGRTAGVRMRTCAAYLRIGPINKVVSLRSHTPRIPLHLLHKYPERRIQLNFSWLQSGKRSLCLGRPIDQHGSQRGQRGFVLSRLRYPESCMSSRMPFTYGPVSDLINGPSFREEEHAAMFASWSSLPLMRLCRSGAVEMRG